MINLDRVAREIKTVGLYDLVLQDVQRAAGKNRISEEEILQILEKDPQLLQDYMQTNVEYNLSNLHVKDIDVKDLKDDCKQKALQFNQNLSQLRELEKYTLDFEQSATLVIIFSIEFFVLFSVQYFIVLLNLKEWQWWIYAAFGSTVLFAWLYARKQGKLYKKNKKIYDEKYRQTLELLAQMHSQKCVDKSELLVEECEEHV